MWMHKKYVNNSHIHIWCLCIIIRKLFFAVSVAHHTQKKSLQIFTVEIITIIWGRRYRDKKWGGIGDTWGAQGEASWMKNVLEMTKNSWREFQVIWNNLYPKQRHKENNVNGPGGFGWKWSAFFICFRK